MLHLYRDVFKSFQSHKVKYVVIGGIGLESPKIKRMTPKTNAESNQFASKDKGLFVNPLQFVPESFRPGEFRDLLSWDKEEITKDAGVYVLLADKTVFSYPGGDSAIFYIGQSNRLRRRLRHHKDRITKASSPDREHVIYMPVYEYAAKFGAQVAVLVSEEPRKTEFQLLAHFAKTFQSLPVANSSVNRRNIRKLFTVEKEDEAETLD